MFWKGKILYGIQSPIIPNMQLCHCSELQKYWNLVPNYFFFKGGVGPFFFSSFWYHGYCRFQGVRNPALIYVDYNKHLFFGCIPSWIHQQQGTLMKGHSFKTNWRTNPYSEGLNITLSVWTWLLLSKMCLSWLSNQVQEKALYQHS